MVRLFWFIFGIILQQGLILSILHIGGNMSKRQWCISLVLSTSKVHHYFVVGESREESIIRVVNLFEDRFKLTLTKVISRELK